jgi:hypothetical protein
VEILGYLKLPGLLLLGPPNSTSQSIWICMFFIPLAFI